MSVFTSDHKCSVGRMLFHRVSSIQSNQGGRKQANMNIQNEKVFADKVLEQLECKIDLVATKWIKRKRSGGTSFFENKKEFEVVEGMSRDIMNVPHPISPEKTMYVYDMIQRASQLFDEMEGVGSDCK